MTIDRDTRADHAEPVAFIVTVEGWGQEGAGVFLAKNHLAARRASLALAKDAGFDIPLSRLRASRSPKHDRLREIKDGSGMGLTFADRALAILEGKAT